MFGKQDARQGAVGLPAIADLAGEIGRALALAPVPFVRLRPGFELAPEQGLEAGAGGGEQRGVDEAVEEEEAAGVELGDLGGGEGGHGRAPVGAGQIHLRPL